MRLAPPMLPSAKVKTDGRCVSTSEPQRPPRSNSVSKRILVSPPCPISKPGGWLGEIRDELDHHPSTRKME